MAPDSKLFPNKAGKSLHWATRQKHRKISREAARDAAKGVVPPTPLDGTVHLAIHARYGYRRRLPDLDATIAACKPHIDGLVEAGVLVDDRIITRISATHERVTKDADCALTGQTILTLTER